MRQKAREVGMSSKPFKVITFLTQQCLISDYVCLRDYVSLQRNAKYLLYSLFIYYVIKTPKKCSSTSIQ